CYPYLIAIARKRVAFAAAGDVAVGADDVAQVAALNVHRFLKNFDASKGSFGAWVGIQADRAASDTRGRAAARKRGAPTRTGPQKGRGCDERLAAVADRKVPRPPDAAGARDAAEWVWDKVASIVTPLELDVLRLRFAEGLEFEQIGRLLGVSWQAA